MAWQISEAAPSVERRLVMTYDEFLAWTDEDTHAEWVDGEVTVFMPPTIRHAEIAGFLYSLLSLFARVLNLGKVLVEPVEMCFRPGRSSRQPDLLFVAREHLDRLHPKRLVGPADLVVEVISDESVIRDRVKKFAEYAAAGVPEYWLFDPRPGEHTSGLYRLTAISTYETIPPDAEGRYHSIVLPGFWLRPEWLWQDPLPDPEPLVAEIAPAAWRSFLVRTGAAPAADV